MKSYDTTFFLTSLSVYALFLFFFFLNLFIKHYSSTFFSITYQGTEAIEGIIPSNFDYHKALEGVTFVTKTFKRMSVLRFLHLSSGNVSGNFEQAFENLRWLRWDHFPLKCLPSEFCPQELVFLALPSSKMRTFWELNMVGKPQYATFSNSILFLCRICD